MKSIRGRLLMILLPGLALTLLCGGAAVQWIARASLTRQFDAGLKARAHSLASLVKQEPEALVFESGDAPAAVVADTFFELRTKSGRVLKRSANLGELTLPQRDASGSEPLFDNTALPGALEGRAVWMEFQPRIDPDDWEGHKKSDSAQERLILTAAMDRSPIDRAMTTLLAALIAVGGVVGITVAALVVVGIRMGLIPVYRLSRQLGEVTGQTLSTQLDARGAPAELMPVYRELNDMFSRVERTLDRERSFAAAAAHELRTPLTELRAAAEVALRWPDADREAKTLREILAVSREMERLVESLLLLSRANACAVGAPTGEVTVAAIVNSCLQRKTDMIREKELQVTSELNGAESLLIVNGTGKAVEIIVGNLIDNAVHYTPPRGSIAIHDRGAASALHGLVVENGPVELTQDDLPRLFEPFWRKDGSHSDRSHAGLGLSIVQRMAGALGMRVDASLSDRRLLICVTPSD